MFPAGTILYTPDLRVQYEGAKKSTITASGGAQALIT